MRMDDWVGIDREELRGVRLTEPISEARTRKGLSLTAFGGDESFSFNKIIKLQKGPSWARFEAI